MTEPSQPETPPTQAFTVDAAVSLPASLFRPEDQPPAPEPPSWPDQAGRITLMGELARGGMGVVLRGHDPDLGRDLAVKLLRDAGADQPDLVRRFVEEARIGGRLEHPGIVPVHEMGRFPDGRPYFTMKLVQGKTLAELLAERTAGMNPAARPDANEPPGLSRRSDLPRFLGIFLQVCQTVAFAHSKGVLHRDLKPANVMVGAFGEVLVMDWGLGKVKNPTPSGPPSPKRGGGESRLATVAASSPRPPSDLPPSPLRGGGAGGGGVEPLTQAGDILGTPAYMPPEQARGETDRLDARSDVFGLGAILCEILTGKPPYSGGTTLEILRLAQEGDLAVCAARLETSGADPELIALCRACLDPDPERRPADAAAVAERLTAYQARVAERLRAAEWAAVRGAEARKRLLVTFALAAVLAVAGGGYLWQRQQAADRAAQAERDVTAAQDEAIQLLRHGRWREALARAQLAEGLLHAAPGLPERLHPGVPALRADLDLLIRLDDHRWQAFDVQEGYFATAAAVRQAGAAFAQAGIPAPDRQPREAAAAIRARPIAGELIGLVDYWAMLADDPADAQNLTLAARLAEGNPDSLADQVRAAAGARNRAALRALARQAPGAGLSAPLWRLLGHGHFWTGDAAEGLDVLRQGLIDHPGDFWLHHSLGLKLLEQRPPDAAGAVRHLTAAVALRDQAGAALNLGHALVAAGRAAEAQAVLERVAARHPDLALAHLNLGVALQKGGQVPQAVTRYRRALALRPDYPRAYHNLATALFALGDLEGAAAASREALRRDPGDAAAYRHLGNALLKAGKKAEAEQAYRDGLALRPRDAWLQTGLGNALIALGRVPEAQAVLEAAVAADPDLAEARAKLGLALAHQDQVAPALDQFERAVRLDPQHYEAQANRAEALSQLGRDAEAEAAFRAALAVRPNAVGGLVSLAGLLVKRGAYAEALPLFRRAHELCGGKANGPFPTERLLRETQRRAELAERLPAVMRGAAAVAGPEEALELAPVAAALGQPAWAVKFYRQAFQGLPGRAEQREQAHRYRAALAALRAGDRAQALTWLREELAAWRQAPAGEGASRREALQDWRREPALAAVRAPEQLAALPEAEAAGWRHLWADVAALGK